MELSPLPFNGHEDAQGTRTQLKNLSNKHEEILLWLLEHPFAKLSECALACGVTQGWLSQIIHSDLFQARLAEVRGEILNVGVLSLHEKVSALASEAVDALLEKLPEIEDAERLESIADMTLKRLGFGTSAAPAVAAPVINNNIIVADKASLAQARSIVREVKAALPPLAAHNDAEESRRPAEEPAKLEVDSP